MPLPVADIGDKLTVTDTTYVDANDYIYTAESGRFFLLKEISVTGDSNFFSNGRVQIFIKDFAFTSKSGKSTEVALTSGITFPFETKDRVILEPGQNITVSSRVITGSAVSQTSVIGILMTETEVEEFKKTGEVPI